MLKELANLGYGMFYRITHTRSLGFQLHNYLLIPLQDLDNNETNQLHASTANLLPKNRTQGLILHMN